LNLANNYSFLKKAFFVMEKGLEAKAKLERSYPPFKLCSITRISMKYPSGN
jgi:hypothetical protein